MKFNKNRVVKLSNNTHIISTSLSLITFNNGLVNFQDNDTIVNNSNVIKCSEIYLGFLCLLQM